MANTRRRTTYTRAWVVAVLAWSVTRSVVVSHTLGRYGVNPWTYGALDLAASWPYAVATAGVVTNLIDGHKAAARRSVAISVVTFLTPDAYLALAGHEKPRVVYVIFGLISLTLAISAALSIALKVRAGRQFVDA